VFRTSRHPVRLMYIRKDLPSYVFWESVGQRVLASAGIRKIFHNFYPGGRHEMPNEMRISRGGFPELAGGSA
jgi:hypothetical protein